MRISESMCNLKIEGDYYRLNCSLSNEKRRLVTPNSNLEVNTEHHLEVSKDVESEEGISLETNFELNFTTGEEAK